MWRNISSRIRRNPFVPLYDITPENEPGSVCLAFFINATRERINPETRPTRPLPRWQIAVKMVKRLGTSDISVEELQIPTYTLMTLPSTPLSAFLMLSHGENTRKPFTPRALPILEASPSRNLLLPLYYREGREKTIASCLWLSRHGHGHISARIYHGTEGCRSSTGIS